VDPLRDLKIDLNTKVFEELKKIETACEADAKIYYDQLEYALARKRYCNGDQLTPQEETLLEQRGFADVTPKRPSPALFLDDCQSGPIFSNSNKNAFTNLVLRSRHIAQGTGLSIFLAAQTSRGIPRSLRLNFTHLFLWRTHSIREKKILYEEVGGMMSEHEFERLLDLYTHLPHSYMFVDCIAKTVNNTF
jgi:hypothetical protein